MGVMTSQITSLTIVYSTVYSGADQRKHQSSASLAFVQGIYWGLVNSPHKWPVTRKLFPFDAVIMKVHGAQLGPTGRQWALCWPHEPCYLGIPFSPLNTLRPRQNGRHFPDNTFKYIFLNENVTISLKISLKFVPKGPINNISALVQIMAWRCSGDKPLSEPMMVSLPTHICVTWPQWVNKALFSLHGWTTTNWAAFTTTKTNKLGFFIFPMSWSIRTLP